LALVPAGALILLAGHAAPHGVEWYTSPVGAIVAWRPALLFFPRFVLSQETLPLSLLNLGAIVLTVLPGWALFHGRDPDRGRNVLLWFGVASFACAVIPISRIGEFYLVNVRFLPAGAAGIVAAVSSIRRNRSLELFVACFALLVSGIELERFRDFSRQAVPVARAVERMIAEQGATLVLARGFPEEFDKSASVIFSGAVRPFLHMRRRADLTAEMPSPRTFETGLLERVSDPVLEERRDLEYALEHARSAEEASGFVRAHEASIGRLYERIVIIGSKQTRALLAGAFRAEYPVSDERTEALVLRKGS
jgi:hypothetical protein